MFVQSVNLARQHLLFLGTAFKLALATTYLVVSQWFNKANHADLQMLSPFLKKHSKKPPAFTIRCLQRCTSKPCSVSPPN
jgi:hypothetical protein